MPGLIVSVSHGLSQDEALRRIRSAVAHSKVQYSGKLSDLHESWNGYLGAFDASGVGTEGEITVRALHSLLYCFFCFTRVII